MYKPKTLFTGYKIGQKNDSLYVGVPDKYFIAGKVKVDFDNEVREFDKTKSVTTREFNDKFRPNTTYTLYYFLWKKVSDEVETDSD